MIPVQVDSNSENLGIQTPPTNGTSNKDAQKDYIVYTRRSGQHTKVVEQVTTEAHSHESSPNSPGSTQANDSTSYISPNESDDLNILVALRKGKRSCTMHPISNFVSYDKLSPKYKAFALSVSEIQVPRNFQKAISKKEWANAVREEVNALQKSKTWEYTNLPSGKKTVGCKWVFAVKYNSDGSVNRFKARLVTKGFTRSYRIDYA